MKRVTLIETSTLVWSLILTFVIGILVGLAWAYYQGQL